MTVAPPVRRVPEGAAAAGRRCPPIRPPSKAGTARALSGFHRARPPAVLPLAEQLLQLRHDLFREQPRVVAGEVLVHVAELQQQHQVADIQIGRDFAKLFGDLIGGADDDVAVVDDRIHFAGRAC